MNRFAWALIATLAVSCAGAPQADSAPPQEAEDKSTREAVGQVPRDATALCHDGSWSSSQNRRGACSSHGGIKAWFGKPPKTATARCVDGTYSKSASSQGTCSSHGGVAYWLDDAKEKK